jgi:hypothetical protein
MKNVTLNLCIGVFLFLSQFSNAQDIYPEQESPKTQHYVVKKSLPITNPLYLKFDLMDEILFSENFADSLNGNPGNGPWTREGQHGLVWRWDFDGPDGPLIEDGVPLLSTTGEDGFMIFDADAADPISIGIPRTGFLVSPLIDFSDAQSTILQYQQFFNYCCYNFSPLYIGISSDSGNTWVDLNAIPGYTDGANTFSTNPMVTNLDISPYAAGHSGVKIRFGFNPEDYDGFTHYFWAVDDILIYVNPVEYDLAINTIYLTDIQEDFEYLRIPSAQANDQRFTVVTTNNGGQVQTNVYAEVAVFQPNGQTETFYSDTITLNPGVRDTLYIFSDLIPDELGLYNCDITVMSDQFADDEIPNNNTMGKSFNTNTHIMSHEHGTFFDMATGSRVDGDNPGTYKEFALGSMFKMQATAVLDGIQAQVSDSSSVGKEIYPVIYKILGGGIQGLIEDVAGYSIEALLDPYTITEEDLAGDVFNIAFSNVVTLEPNEFYMIALYSESNSEAVYFQALADGDEDLSTIRYGVNQFGDDNWFNGYPFTPAIRLNFDIALAVNENDDLLQEVVLYPNPASSFVDIAFQTRSGEEISILIYDMTGKQIMNKQLGMLPTGKQKLHLDISNLNAGMYFYELNQGEATITDKFIVN